MSGDVEVGTRDPEEFDKREVKLYLKTMNQQKTFALKVERVFEEYEWEKDPHANYTALL